MLSKNTVQKIVAAYLRRLPLKIEFAILFGSSVYGERLHGSDVDLIVVSDDFEKMPYHERMFLMQNYWVHNSYLESFAYTPKEFERLRKISVTVREASRKGLKLYVTDKISVLEKY